MDFTLILYVTQIPIHHILKRKIGMYWIEQVYLEIIYVKVKMITNQQVSFTVYS